MYRVFFDANSGSYEGGYYLCFDLSKQDINAMGSALNEGQLVTLYDTDELEFRAYLSYDTEYNCWLGIPCDQ
jgi:hypothetical protein